MAGITITRIAVVAALAVLLVAAGSASAGSTIYVPDDYTTIRAAVNAANSGDTIIVRDGTYTENVHVNKRHLTIRSENGSESTTVEVNRPNRQVFKVTANYVNISGFNVAGATGATSTYPWAGIRLIRANNCHIANNIVTGNGVGIRLHNSDNNNITGNRVQHNTLSGFVLTRGSTGNNISHNSITAGIVSTRTVSPSCLECPVGQCDITTNVANGNYVGIGMLNSGNNIITKNVVTGNYIGIGMLNSDNNNITCNRVQNNTLSGFVLTWMSTGNNISYNNIIENGDPRGDGIYHWQFNNAQAADVTAQHNYWGTNDGSEIDASIWDDEDSFGHWRGKVTFEQFEKESCPCAPVPELPTIALLAVGLLALVGYGRTGRKE